MRTLLGIIVLGAAAAAAGCLQKDTTHTIYLSPDGRATWMVIEKDVRSDETDPARRFSEEQAYLSAAKTDDHGVGRGLAAIGPERLRTRVIRGERPFIVVTEAEFVSLDLAVQRMVNELGLPADVLVTADGPVTTLRVRIDAVWAAESESDGTRGAGSPVTDLLEDVDRYRFVLTDGRFVAATGFTLSDGDTIAVPFETPWEDIVRNGGILELSLSWER